MHCQIWQRSNTQKLTESIIFKMLPQNTKKNSSQTSQKSSGKQGERAHSVPGLKICQAKFDKNNRNIVLKDQKINAFGLVYQAQFSEIFPENFYKRNQFNIESGLIEDAIRQSLEEFNDYLEQAILPQSAAKADLKKALKQMVEDFFSHSELSGDFDMKMSEQKSYRQTHEKLIEHMKKCCLYQGEFWTLEDFLNLQRTQNEEVKTNFIFEIKRNFNAGRNQNSPMFEKISLARAIENHKSYLKQMLKLPLAARALQYEAFNKKQQQKGFTNYLKMQNHEIVLEQKQALTSIYYVINHHMEKQEFQKTIEPLKPILRYWFHSFGAILHIIGYNPESEYFITQRKRLQESRRRDEQQRKRFQEFKMREEQQRKIYLESRRRDEQQRKRFQEFKMREEQQRKIYLESRRRDEQQMRKLRESHQQLLIKVGQLLKAEEELKKKNEIAEQ